MDLDKLATRLKHSLPLATMFSGVCYRNVSLRYATQRDILSTVGSRVRGGRYNLVNAFEVLYLSCDPFTCLKETLSQGRQATIEFAYFLPRTIIGIEVSLSVVLDLTSHQMRRRLGLTKSILTETDWLNIQEEERREAITQAVGRLSRAAGFEALLVPSAVCAGVNLNIFPDRLRPTSSLVVIRGEELTP
jgi:RES domain-containing protein